ncbi:sterile alpha motif domain-containing protein 3 isoform X5 [Elephas maximus indicus]|uniref:sterile alpha motif domain-containing protein 3 isoform X5 n=1 Tax=Elephas maximus indicus TaxID=99487 RepID=UPI002116B2A6|nr:sterile alpha motif domain-containing protein 3 isoform X5 [Elephas maximus indicus]
MSLLRAEVILPVQTACVLQCFAGKPCRNFFFFFFPEEEVSGAALLALNDRMVQQLAKKIGHQAVLMDLIKKYKQNSQALQSPGSPRQTALIRQTEAAPERTMKYVLARNKALQWTKPYVLPEFPYDVKCMLAEQKCPDHSMRIRMIEFLQADMTKYLEGSLYPSTQQYNNVVNALLQAHPFLDEDGCGFFLWKRALKDRFKYVRRPIEDDEQVMRNKCKFGHRRGQKRKSLADLKCDEIHSVQMKKEAVCLDSEVNEHINWFQQEYVKTEKDWREIDNRMTQTLELRRKLIDSRTPLKDILKMFPFLKCPHQIFREFQLLTRTDIYKKTQHILESYSENILTSFIVADNPINIALQEKMKQYTDEDMLKQMKMTATCLLLPDVFGDDPSLFVVVNEKVQVSTPVLEVKNPFNINDCEFSLYLEKERLTKVDDCVMALAALIAAFHVFGIKCPQRLRQTLKFLKTLIFDMHHPYFPPITGKKGRFQHSAI